MRRYSCLVLAALDRHFGLDWLAGWWMVDMAWHGSTGGNKVELEAQEAECQTRQDDTGRQETRRSQHDGTKSTERMGRLVCVDNSAYCQSSVISHPPQSTTRHLPVNSSSNDSTPTSCIILTNIVSCSQNGSSSCSLLPLL